MSQAEASLAAEVVAGGAEMKRKAARMDAVIAERDRGLEQASLACSLASDLLPRPCTLLDSCTLVDPARCFLFFLYLLLQYIFSYPHVFSLYHIIS